MGTSSLNMRELGDDFLCMDSDSLGGCLPVARRLISEPLPERGINNTEVSVGAIRQFYGLGSSLGYG
jgi:hypothetical protein